MQFQIRCNGRFRYLCASEDQYFQVKASLMVKEDLAWSLEGPATISQKLPIESWSDPPPTAIQRLYGISSSG